MTEGIVSRELTTNLPMQKIEPRQAEAKDECRKRTEGRGLTTLRREGSDRTERGGGGGRSLVE